MMKDKKAEHDAEWDRLADERAAELASGTVQALDGAAVIRQLRALVTADISKQPMPKKGDKHLVKRR